MLVFISGPVTGVPNHNRERFERVARRLLAAGHRAINPHVLCSDLGPDAPHSAYMRRCVAALVDSEAIVMLPGWPHSDGARAEQWIARICGIPELRDVDVR